MARLIRKLIAVLLIIAAADQCLSSRQESCHRYGLNYSLPMFDICGKKEHQNGSIVHTIPKLIPAFHVKDTRCGRQGKLGIPSGQRVCRFPDCMNDPCLNGWCEETMTGYKCHISEAIYDDLGNETAMTDVAFSKTGLTSATIGLPTAQTAACFSSPCHNGGTCQEISLGFECICHSMFYGNLCECLIKHTRDLGGNRVYTVPGSWIHQNMTSFDFEVSANNDAHIALFPSNETTDRYEIAIGGWGNTGGRMLRYDDVSYPNLPALYPHRDDPVAFGLSGIPHYDHYQISFGNGRIKLKRYGNDTALIDVTDTNPLAINYVGIWTGFGSEGYWKFPTLC